jgi:phosphate-selective porin OprO/OprP
VLCLIAACAAPLAAQARPDSAKPPVEFNDRGITFNARDGVSSLNLRFRVQEWAVFTTGNNNLSLAQTQFATRRARLRLEGVVWDPRLTVIMQLAFARSDMDPDQPPGVVNVVRDAVIRWRATPRFTIAAGQTKLPGNRQRMNSSSELAFADRSLVNNVLGVDRDVGVFGYYENRDLKTPFNVRFAVTEGEGRNPSTGDAGLSYTGRVEWLPLGAFTGTSDFTEADLAREKEGRLSIGTAISRNDGAVRTNGQLGKSLFAPRGITTLFADAIFKRQGFSISGEYIRKSSPNPVTRSGTEARYVPTGEGVSMQAGYVTLSRFEPVFRFSQLTPNSDLASQPDVEWQREFSVGLNRYLKGHRVKVQGELMHDEYRKLLNGARRNTWTFRTSIEVGI